MTFLLDCSLRTAVIVAVGLVMASLLHRSSAATRHSLLTVAILCAAVLPVLTGAVPQWNLEAPAALWEVYGFGKAIPSSASSAGAGAIKPPEGAGRAPVHDSAGSEASAPSAPSPLAQAASLDATVASPDDLKTKARQPSYVLVWAAGTTISLIVLLIGWLHLAWIAWASKPVHHAKWTSGAEEIARIYGLRRKIRLLHSRHPAILATWGLLRPKVVLPSDAEHWQEGRIQVVLRHEFAHIRRHDWLIQMLSELLRALYWFNPLIWIACARLRRESEQACDDIVINSGVEGPDYAAHLLDLARTFRTTRDAWSPALLMARESTLEQRFKALLNPNLNRQALTRLAIALTGILFLGITLPVAALRVSAQEVLALELPVGVFSFSAPFALMAPPATRPQSGSGAIEGFAVRSDTGEPLAEVHIELNTPTDRSNSRVAATGRDGRFNFDNVPPGEYQLVAVRAGGYLPAEYGQRSPTGRGMTIQLAAGQKMTGVRISLAHPGSISGRVLDRDGEPVGRAQVQALRTVYVDGRRSEMMAASVATDDRGEYRLYWLPPGRYYVSVTPQDARRGWVPVIAKSLDNPASFYTLVSNPIVTRRVLDTGEVQEEVQVQVYFPGTTDLQAAEAIEVRAGASLTAIDITVDPPARAHRIRGVLLDSGTGQPLADGSVRATPLASTGNMMGRIATSDRNGKFEISGLLPGSYILVGTGGFDGDRSGLAASLPVTLGNTDLENVALPLSVGFDIPVRVAVEGRTSGGGVSMRLQTVPGQSFLGGFMPTRPGTPQYNLLATSQFKLEGVKPGDYKLAFNGMGGAGPGSSMPAYVKSMRMGATDLSNGFLHLDGDPEHPLEIVLSANMSTLEGTVVSDKQEPATNVIVAVVPDTPYRARADLYKTVMTDASGRFRISDIAPGSYRVFSWDDVEGWAWQDPDWLRLYEGRGKPIHFLEGGKENVQLTVISTNH